MTSRRQHTTRDTTANNPQSLWDVPPITLTGVLSTCILNIGRKANAPRVRDDYSNKIRFLRKTFYFFAHSLNMISCFNNLCLCFRAGGTLLVYTNSPDCERCLLAIKFSTDSWLRTRPDKCKQFYMITRLLPFANYDIHICTSEFNYVQFVRKHVITTFSFYIRALGKYENRSHDRKIYKDAFEFSSIKANIQMEQPM